MNEQIMKWAEEARLHAKGIYPEVNDLKAWVQVYHEKFAELIVRECAGLFNPKDTDSCYPPASVREIIEEHFGVE